MRTLSQADCLDLWERGRTLHPLDQGLLAIHAAFPETRHESVADWPLGRRNRALAQLHCASFGRRLRGWTSCRQCGEQLEFDLDGAAIADDCAPLRDAPIDVRGQRFRLPTTRDLATIVSLHEPIEASLRLLEQCRAENGAHADAEATEDPQAPDRHAWTQDEVEAIGAQMALADPLAEIMLDIDCPVCGVSFQESLDLPAFLWAEIEAQSRRLLLDVHALASAYGWSESDILSLSAARRALYLQMVQG